MKQQQTISKNQSHTCEAAGVNPKFFTTAYRRGFDRTKRFLASRGVPPQSSEELAQAAWARGWECRNKLRDPKRIGSWVNTIAINLFRSRFRTEKLHDELPELAAPTNMQEPSVSVDVSRMLKHCKPSEGTLLWQCYVEGYTSSELAKMWGCKPVAIRVRLMRARRKLAGALGSAR